jgi:hypothetical protein
VPICPPISTPERFQGHHPHLHALVPGGGPSVNYDNDPCWITARDVTRPWRTEKPSLVDNVALGRTFRDKFVRGLGWLIRHGKLKLADEWQQLHNPNLLRRWLKKLKETDWNVFIQGPPHGQSDPRQVIKYLTRYMTGGPISDHRIESDEGGWSRLRRGGLVLSPGWVVFPDASTLLPLKSGPRAG